MLQPSLGDGGSTEDAFGLVKRAKSMKFGGATNYVDAAIISLAVNESWFDILEVGDVKPYPFALKTDYSLGQEVIKSGRTTGIIPPPVTTIVDKNAVVNVDYSRGEGGANNTAYFTNQIIYTAATRMTNNGDSGSAILALIDGVHYIVGLNFAGNSSGTMGVACGIEDVASALNIEAWDGNVVVPSTEENEIWIFNKKYVRVGETSYPITHYIGESSSSSSYSSSLSSDSSSSYSSSSSSSSLSSDSSSSSIIMDHLFLSVNTPGLNQWTALKPLIEAGSFSYVTTFSAASTQYGFYSGPNYTMGLLEAHKVDGGAISTIDMDYRRYKYSGAQSLTYYLVVSQNEPTIGGDLLGWDVFGQITPNGSDYTTDYNIDISACLAFVDESQDFWIGAISKPHYDGDDPSTWPNSHGNGGSVWLNIYGFNIS
jgi:hypothetical protein